MLVHLLSSFQNELFSFKSTYEGKVGEKVGIQ